MSLITNQLEDSLVIESRALLSKIKLTHCPIWRFHYLGAISAYCELVSKLKNKLSNNVYEQLMDVEKQAISEISQNNHFAKH